MIYLELFWSFVQVGLFCVGGGYAFVVVNGMEAYPPPTQNKHLNKSPK